ncbi:MAG: phosphopantetheinyl transferase [Cyanobacteria bacterium RYN_339]|nr:phosphopantetheinyl transferase [Cyanobacteria bacterium RYN_339]
MSVRLWLADLDGPNAGLWLAPEEEARRDRFVFPVHRHRFARGRGLLRQVLARELAIAPEAVAFTYNAYGRPTVEGLAFNVSHAENQLMIAVAAHNLGVDIEAVRLLDDQRGVARTAFSAAELDAWLALSENERPQAFYRLWTRKEAVMKASGLGFAMGSRSFTLALDEGPQRFGGYAVVDLAAPPGYQAALAFEGPEPVVAVNTL